MDKTEWNERDGDESNVIGMRWKGQEEGVG